jgi:hypothetical protein
MRGQLLRVGLGGSPRLAGVAFAGAPDWSAVELNLGPGRLSCSPPTCFPDLYVRLLRRGLRPCGTCTRVVTRLSRRLTMAWFGLPQSSWAARPQCTGRAWPCHQLQCSMGSVD